MARRKREPDAARLARVPVYGTEPYSDIAKAVECLRLLGDQTECVAVSVSGYHLRPMASFTFQPKRS